MSHYEIVNVQTTANLDHSKKIESITKEKVDQIRVETSKILKEAYQKILKKSQELRGSPSVKTILESDRYDPQVKQAVSDGLISISQIAVEAFRWDEINFKSDSKYSLTSAVFDKEMINRALEFYYQNETYDERSSYRLALEMVYDQAIGISKFFEMVLVGIEEINEITQKDKQQEAYILWMKIHKILKVARGTEDLEQLKRLVKRGEVVGVNLHDFSKMIQKGLIPLPVSEYIGADGKINNDLWHKVIYESAVELLEERLIGKITRYNSIRVGEKICLLIYKSYARRRGIKGYEAEIDLYGHPNEKMANLKKFREEISKKMEKASEEIKGCVLELEGAMEDRAVIGRILTRFSGRILVLEDGLKVRVSKKLFKKALLGINNLAESAQIINQKSYATDVVFERKINQLTQTQFLKGVNNPLNTYAWVIEALHKRAIVELEVFGQIAKRLIKMVAEIKEFKFTQALVKEPKEEKRLERQIIQILEMGRLDLEEMILLQIKHNL